MWEALLFVVALAGMELVAALTHRHVMHGPLWVLHRSHHEPRRGSFEANDLFAVFFSLPSIVLISLGTHGAPSCLPLGLGMAAYGLLYVLFHDVLVHRRVRVRWRPAGRYLERLVRAHLVHHKTVTRDGAVCFGFLYARDPSRSSPSTSEEAGGFGTS